jgi:hypothetical protein
MGIVYKYKNIGLDERIKNMERIRKKMILEINNLDANLLEIKRLYATEKSIYYISNKICASCYTSCDEINEDVTYCQECKDNDSCLNDN